MPRRAASVTQADVARTIRAMLQAGLRVVRVVTRKDGVSVETDAGPEQTADAPNIEPEREIVL